MFINYKFFIIFIILFILLYFINIFLKKKELFHSENNGLLCGTKNDECMVDQDGYSNCCTGYTCYRIKNNFHNKVCVNNNELPDDYNKDKTASNKKSSKISSEEVDLIINSIYIHYTNGEGEEDFYLHNIINNESNRTLYQTDKEVIEISTLKEMDKSYNPSTKKLSNKLKYTNINDNYINEIKNYLNYINLPNTSILINLRDYINTLQLPDGYKYIDLFDKSITNNITSYLYIDILKYHNINYKEFINYIINLNSTNKEDMMIYLETLDTDNNGKIILSELKNYLNYLKIPNNSKLINLKNLLNSLDLPPTETNTTYYITNNTPKFKFLYDFFKNIKINPFECSN